MKVSRRKFIKIAAGAVAAAAIWPRALVSSKPRTITGTDGQIWLGDMGPIKVSQELLDDAAWTMWAFVGTPPDYTGATRDGGWRYRGIKNGMGLWTKDIP